MKQTLTASMPIFVVTALSLLPSAAAHDYLLLVEQTSSSNISEVIPNMETYHQFPRYHAWIVLHILLMTVGWVLLLPISEYPNTLITCSAYNLGVLLSIARSRYTKSLQLSFLTCNGIGVLFGGVYNHHTPDLYPKNAHHGLGWVMTLSILVQFVIGVLGSRRSSGRNGVFAPISQEGENRENSSFQRDYLPTSQPRFSQDSGNGTIETPSSRSSSCTGNTMAADHRDTQLQRLDRSRQSTGSTRKLLSHARELPTIFCNAVDRTILLLGFATLATGWVTYGGLFKDTAVFSGLAHFLKGGVFFWFGVLSLSRWAGSFHDIGWAWNIQPAGLSKRTPSAEFVESFLIFLYGATNIFLEHLAAWGKEWSAVDLEHISLTVLFIGGGVVGLEDVPRKYKELIESRLECL